MKEHIQKTLSDLAENEQIKILYACESGSRAWGFASPDSDWDVRFIYVNQLNWYLDLEKKSDTIDLMLPLELDLGGWDLQKALRLFASCNLALYEWINSPKLYLINSEFHVKIQSLIPDYFSAIKGMHHYLAMANKNFESHLEGTQIKIKKLFYILRPLLACEWISNKKTMPPTEYQLLLSSSKRLSNDRLDEVLNFMKMKETAAEGFLIDLSEELIQWISNEIDYYKNIARDLPSAKEKDWKPLNQLFIDCVK